MLGRDHEKDVPSTETVERVVGHAACFNADRSQVITEATAVFWSSNVLTDSQSSTRGSLTRTGCSLATRLFWKRGILISPAYARS
jgi:hypothetical protein